MPTILDRHQMQMVVFRLALTPQPLQQIRMAMHKIKIRIKQQILKGQTMPQLMLGQFENPQQHKIGLEAIMLQDRLKTEIEICRLQRQHSQHPKMLIPMQTGQLVTM